MNVTETIQRKEMKKMKDDIELILSMLTGGKQRVIKQNSSSRSIDTLGTLGFFLLPWPNLDMFPC